MLIQFTVKNYLSIKDEITLSMLAGSGSDHMEKLIHFGKENVLRTAGIYGANAAGKSNIFKAITAALIIIRSSNVMQINQEIPLISAFAFDEESRTEPSEFGFIFTVGNHKYEYGFSADSKKVYSEYLYAYFSSRATRIFERTCTDKYIFNKADMAEFNDYREKTSANKLFLATATSWNCKKTKEAYLWLSEDIESFGGYQAITGAALPYIAADNDQKLREFTLGMLHHADINISDYKVKTEELKDNNANGIKISIVADNGMPIAVPQMTQTRTEIETTHVITSNGQSKEFHLPASAESSGTMNIFFFSPLLKKALENGSTLVVDEINDNLHPMLVKYVVDLFEDPETNTNNAQLIFITHDLSLLTLDDFRRDQIYFAEKDNETGTTDLYSLDEFSPRKTENVRKGYLQGRYGAVPVILEGGPLW